jgi:hypothetical protein
MKRTPRKASRLSESVHRNLNSYALAASAAGVGVLALAQSAEGRIVYTPADHIIDYSHRYYHFNLNHGGESDFGIAYYSGHSTTNWGGVLATAQNGNQVDAVYHRANALSFPGYWALALSRGVKVGPSNFRGVRKGTMLINWGTSRTWWGYWLNATNHYLGLKFGINGKTHYGWARVSVTGRAGAIRATLTGYAYETIPNKPIVAGKTTGPDVVTIRPASLGHLAHGAAAIPAWRVQP